MRVRSSILSARRAAVHLSVAHIVCAEQQTSAIPQQRATQSDSGGKSMTRRERGELGWKRSATDSRTVCSSKCGARTNCSHIQTTTSAQHNTTQRNTQHSTAQHNTHTIRSGVMTRFGCCSAECSALWALTRTVSAECSALVGSSTEAEPDTAPAPPPAYNI
jgi:hypothetical protein